MISLWELQEQVVNGFIDVFDEQGQWGQPVYHVVTYSGLLFYKVVDFVTSNRSNYAPVEVNHERHEVTVLDHGKGDALLTLTLDWCVGVTASNGRRYDP